MSMTILVKSSVGIYVGNTNPKGGCLNYIISKKIPENYMKTTELDSRKGHIPDVPRIHHWVCAIKYWVSSCTPGYHFPPSWPETWPRWGRRYLRAQPCPDLGPDLNRVNPTNSPSPSVNRLKHHHTHPSLWTVKETCDALFPSFCIALCVNAPFSIHLHWAKAKKIKDQNVSSKFILKTIFPLTIAQCEWALRSFHT